MAVSSFIIKYIFDQRLVKIRARTSLYIPLAVVKIIAI